MSSPLLEAKLHVPRRRRASSTRPRLSERLGGAVRRRSRWCRHRPGSARRRCWPSGSPAGREGRATAWLSLDAGDNDPARVLVLRHRRAAARRPEVGAERARAAAVGPGASRPSWRPCSTTLAGRRRRGRRWCSTTTTSSSRRRCTRRWRSCSSTSPRRSTWCSPAGPTRRCPLARLRARGELLEVRAADLRFTADEAAAYLNDGDGPGLTADDVDALDARTEGWIAALQLAALSMQGRDDVAGVHRRVRRGRPLRRRLPRRARCWTASPTTCGPSCSRPRSSTG